MKHFKTLGIIMEFNSVFKIKNSTYKNNFWTWVPRSYEGLY